MIREVRFEDLDAMLELYLDLHEVSVPEKDEHLMKTWDTILNDPNHHLIVMEVGGEIVSACGCVVIPNLTRNVRPYALIENVVTKEKHRGRGYARKCLDYAKEIAVADNCYKIMLMTGSKEPSTMRFYESAGYNSLDKTGYIQWLK